MRPLVEHVQGEGLQKISTLDVRRGHLMTDQYPRPQLKSHRPPKFPCPVPETHSCWVTGTSGAGSSGSGIGWGMIHLPLRDASFVHTPVGQ